jgi:hypothetical protein
MCEVSFMPRDRHGVCLLSQLIASSLIHECHVLWSLSKFSLSVLWQECKEEPIISHSKHR